DLGIIELQRGRTLTGRVIREDGSVVEAATVSAGAQVLGDGRTLSGTSRTVTDREGRFSVPEIGDDTLLVTAEHPTEGRSAALPVAPAADSPIELKVQRTGSLEGTLTTKGAPIANGLVVAVPRGVAG